jgi:hypothetical protein
MRAILVAARGHTQPESRGGSFKHNVTWPGLTVESVKSVNIEIKQ